MDEDEERFDPMRIALNSIGTFMVMGAIQNMTKMAEHGVAHVLLQIEALPESSDEQRRKMADQFWATMREDVTPRVLKAGVEVRRCIERARKGELGQEEFERLVSSYTEEACRCKGRHQ